MSKLSIDLDYHDGRVGRKVPVAREQLQAIIDGCVETLRRLGMLNEMVEAIRVTFCYWSPPPLGSQDFHYGPRITVYFHDPFGSKTSYGTDYRFIGSGGSAPSAKEIVEYFCAENCLPLHIGEAIRRGEQRIAEAGAVLRNARGLR